MELNLQGKTVLITGASNGIGKQSAKQFAKEGASVFLTGRNEAALKEVCAEITANGGTASYLAADLSDAKAADALVAKTVEVFGKLDILVCSAGMALRQPSLEMTKEQWDLVMAVNLTAPLLLSQCAIRQFQAQGHGGKIVYVSSTAGKNTNLGASPSYGASKAGLLYLVRHFASEFAKDQIYVNAVCPGPVDTEITKTWTPEHRASVLKNLPLGRMGTPEDIANLILFLSSSASDFIDGESVLINGARYMQ
ncbi:MAG: SDR family oxidoreductase [Erysipelotrichales bacterium]|nr:SDR family oxidoreductase [Erysipelotrichales bacterium]